VLPDAAAAIAYAAARAACDRDSDCCFPCDGCSGDDSGIDYDSDIYSDFYSDFYVSDVSSRPAAVTAPQCKRLGTAAARLERSAHRRACRRDWTHGRAPNASSPALGWHGRCLV
jgi:hypothetical protein